MVLFLQVSNNNFQDISFGTQILFQTLSSLESGLLLELPRVMLESFRHYKYRFMVTSVYFRYFCREHLKRKGIISSLIYVYVIDNQLIFSSSAVFWKLIHSSMTFHQNLLKAEGE